MPNSSTQAAIYGMCEMWTLIHWDNLVSFLLEALRLSLHEQRQ